MGTMDDLPEGLIAAVTLIRRYVPGFKLARRSDSLLLRLLGWLRAETRGYFTTIGATCYLPDAPLTDALWPVVFHEGAHALRAKRWTLPVYVAAYLFPWSLAPVWGALALVSPWFLLGVISCFAPYIAFGRTAIELEGYRVNMLMDYWRNDPGADWSWYIGQLSGATYDYPTWPARAERLVSGTAAAIVASRGTVPGDAYLADVRSFILARFGRPSDAPARSTT
jgi:hypothetical protein